MSPPTTPSPARLERQRELLLEYIADSGQLMPGARFEYLTHEFESRPNETTTVRVDLRMYNVVGAAPEVMSIDIPLDVLKRFQEQKFRSAASPDMRDQVSVVPQRSWNVQRKTLLSLASGLEAECRRHVTCHISTDEQLRKMTCGCIDGRAGHFCKHLQFVYTTGWERAKLLEDGVGSLRAVSLPIGMGLAYINLSAILLEDDTKPLGERRTGYIELYDYTPSSSKTLLALAKEVSPYPTEISKIVLGPGEGAIKAIRYIEGLLRTSSVYDKLSKTNGEKHNPFQVADKVCSRRHIGESGRTLVAQFIAGLRHNNIDRDNWMLACAYTVTAFGLCLPCNNATSSSAFIPHVPTV